MFNISFGALSVIFIYCIFYLFWQFWSSIQRTCLTVYKLTVVQAWQCILV